MSNQRKMDGYIKGFTLLELQISIVILMLAVAGFTLTLMNYGKQIQWLEKRRALYTIVVPGDLSKAIFTEYKTGSTDNITVYKVTVESLTEDETSVTATVLLEEK